MPRLEGYERPSASRGGISAQANPDDFGAGIGRAVAGAAQPLEEANTAWRRQQESLGALHAARTMAEAEQFFTQRVQDEYNSPEFAQKYGPDGGLFSDSLLKEADEYAQKQVAAAPNEYTANLMRGRMIDLKSSVYRSAFSKQIEATAAYSVNSFSSIADAYGTTVQGDPDRYEEYAARLDEDVSRLAYVPADKRVILQSEARKNLAKQAAEGVARDPVRAADLLRKTSPTTAPKYDMNALMDRIFQVESGGKQFGGAGSVAGPDGPTTSVAGAVGKGQVMEAAHIDAARRLGITPDANKLANDENYNALISREYMTMLKEQFGDLEKSVAAYNAGPGRVRQAVARAQQEGGDWKSYLPDETKNYIVKVLGGQPATDSEYVTAFEDTRVASLMPIGVETVAPREEDLPAWMRDLQGPERLSVISILESAVSRGSAKAEAGLKTDVQTLSNQMNDLILPDRTHMTRDRFIEAYGVKAGEAAYAEFDREYNEFAEALAISDRPVANQIIPQGNDIESQARAARISERLDKINDARKKDPIGFEMKRRGIEPLDIGDAARAAQQITERYKLSKEITTGYGAPAKLLAEGEVKQFTDSFVEETPAAQAKFLDGLVRYGGVPYEAVSAMGAQIMRENPAVGRAVQIAGTAAIVDDPTGRGNLVSVASRILQGSNILRDRDGKAKIVQDAFDKEHSLKFMGDIQTEYQDGAASASTIADIMDAQYQAVKALQAADIATGQLKADQARSKLPEYINMVAGEKVRVGAKPTRAPAGMPQAEFKRKFTEAFKRADPVMYDELTKRGIGVGGALNVVAGGLPRQGSDRADLFSAMAAKGVYVDQASPDQYIVQNGGVLATSSVSGGPIIITLGR